MIDRAQFVFLFLNLILVGGLILLGVTLAFKFIPLRRTRFRYVVALLAFAGAFLVPVVSTFRLVPRPSLSASAQHRAGPELELQGGAVVMRPISVTLIRFVRSLEQFVLARKVFVVIPLIWFGGALLLVGREVLGHLAILRTRGLWESANAELEPRLKWKSNYRWFVHDRLGPCVIGLLKPAIVFPRDLVDTLPITTFEQLVRHELAHARWRDPLANAIVRLVRGCFWPSLPLWKLAEVIQGEREAAADQAALKSTTEKSETTDYMATLLSISSGRSSEGAWVFFRYAGTHAGGPVLLEKRIQRLMLTRHEGTHSGFMFGVFILIAAALAVSLSPVATADPSLQDSRVLSEQILFKPGVATAILVKETTSGVVEETVLRRSESELRAVAINQPVPDLPSTEGVMLMIVVNEDGRVSSVRVIAGTADPEVGRRALEAMRQWTFSPAGFEGKPIKVVGTITLLGSLKQDKGWVELR